MYYRIRHFIKGLESTVHYQNSILSKLSPAHGAGDGFDIIKTSLYGDTYGVGIISGVVM